MSKRLIISLFALVVLAACGDDDEPDPCAGYVEPSAFFRAESRYTTWEGYNAEGYVPVTGDTFGLYHKAHLICEQQYDDYTWTVVNDPVAEWKGREISFFVDEELTLDVQLIATRSLAPCYPDSSTTDTFVRRLYFMEPDSNDPYPIIGTYEGYNTDEPDSTYSIRVFIRPNPDFPNQPLQIAIMGFKGPMCDGPNGINVLKDYSMGISLTGPGHYRCGYEYFGWLSKGRNKLTLKMRCTELIMGYACRHTFIGTRKK